MSRERSTEPQAPLAEAIRREVGRHRLDDARVEQLLRQQQQVLAAAAATRTPTRALGLRCAVSLVALILIGLLGWWLLRPPGVDVSRQIALEVVENHLKLKPLDVHTDTIAGIQSYFTQLDFSPVASAALPDQLAPGAPRLLGGRYCSIKGDTAAQLRFQNGAQTVTLYQVGYRASSFGAVPELGDATAPKVLFVKGLQVSIWVEKDLLMVLVQKN